MRTIWSACAAAILINGSISSTSGAADCATPGDARAALAARAPGPGPVYGYHEELRHPALTAPVISRGVMELTLDGALLRRQISPVPETVELRAESMRIYRDGVARDVPIPQDHAPLVALLRSVIRREAPDLEGAVLTGRADGWTLEIPAPGGALRLLGCGERLRAVEMAAEQGARRTIFFEPR